MAEITDLDVSAATRDEEARARLLEVARPQIHGMALARLAADPDRWNAADDVTQEVLVALAEGLPRLERATARGYFAFQSAVVSHKVLDHFRGRRGRERVAAAVEQADVSSLGPLLAALSSPDPTPGSRAARREAADALLDELGSLRESHRDVITLAIFDHLETREIGERLGISRTGAANLLARALAALRVRIARRRAGGGAEP